MLAGSIALLTAILILSMAAVTTVDGQQQQQSSNNNGIPILSSSIIRTGYGSVFVVGEVRNDLPDVLKYVKIVGTFYDSGGRLIDTNFTYTDLDQLRPGEKSPFKLIITDESVLQNLNNYNLTVTGDQVFSSKPAPFNITITDEEIAHNVESVNLTAQSNDYSMIDPELEQVVIQRIQQQKQEDKATTFESIADGFRVQVPTGWIIEDINNTDAAIQERERQFGAGILATLCPKGQAIPEIAGTYRCAQESQGVVVARFGNLKSRPEFAGVVRENKNITTSDLVAFHLLFLEQRFGDKDLRILNNTDIAVNVTDSHTNQTIATAPAKYVEITYIDNLNRVVPRDFALLVLSNDGNTGYILLASAESAMRIGKLPSEQREVFDSFELVNPAAIATAAVAAAPATVTVVPLLMRLDLLS
jgi:hypothetical protein